MKVSEPKIVKKLQTELKELISKRKKLVNNNDTKEYQHILASDLKREEDLKQELKKFDLSSLNAGDRFEITGR